MAVGESTLIGREVLGQHLDGDIPIELRIPGPIRLSHAALTERFKDLDGRIPQAVTTAASLAK